MNTQVELMPTRAAVVSTEATARLLRFERPDGAPPPPKLPLLIVPSLINRWYVVDLRPGATMVGALAAAGHDVFCLDWGIAEAEDRYLSWDDLIDRLHRNILRVQRITGAPKVGLLGYCMGATLSAIEAALHPDRVAAFVNLAGPIDFAAAGRLREMVDPRWFDVDAIADAGNVAALQMQAGFVALRPTLEFAKWVRNLDTAHDADARTAAGALEAWAGDNIPFPGEAYRTYIRELYQENRLVAGSHRVRGRRVVLRSIKCPILVIVAERDQICPPDAATALLHHAGSDDVRALSVPGGHVGAVVGSRASKELYPALAAWLRERL
jgi:polyhydroxyalkanoate synthase subunit PhaC